MKTLKEPKLRYKVDFKEFKKCLALPTLSDEFKKDDIVELVDEKLGINRKCRVIKVEPKGVKTFWNRKYYNPFNTVIVLTDELFT